MIKYENNNIASNIIDNSITKKKLDHNKLFGLWIYLMSDCIIFAVLFAIYVIFSSNITVNLMSHTTFNLSSIFFETCLLLLSSLSCGLIIVAMNQKKIHMIYCYLIITFGLGCAFLCMEMYEFYELICNNLGPDKHALFSIFFTLVGTHGIHIFFGLIFILSILYQLNILGLTNAIYNRILCLSIFWHFLDIIWICIFTFVYLNRYI